MTKRLWALNAINACASNYTGTGQASGGVAYNVASAATSMVKPAEYKTRSLDALDITVFQEPNLAARTAQVNAFCNVNSLLIDHIRSGQAADPQIRSNQVMIVGFSGSRRPWRAIVKAMPLVNIFRPSSDRWSDAR